MTQPNRTQLIVTLGLFYLVAPAWGADRSCLSGTDPSVAVDAGQIAALEATIASECPCASFDGSEGRARRDYRRCVSPLIKAAVKSGQLRSKCKARIGKAHKLATCGTSGLVPCIESKADGKIRCRIVSSEDCQSDARYSRVACSAYTRCVDAGDNDGDMQVASGDSGACIVPPTATLTATATPTSTPTATPTSEVETWTHCANEGDTNFCNSPPNRMVRFGGPGRWLYHFSSGSILCHRSTWGDAISSDSNTCEYSTFEYPTPTPTGAPEWIFCAHPGETCVLPGGGQVVSLGVPQPGDFSSGYTNLITQSSENSIECSPEVFFPGRGFPSRDCYYLQSNPDYEGNPFGLMVTNRGGDFWEMRMLPQLIDDPFHTCGPQGSGGPCQLQDPVSADFSNEIAVFAIDPRITESDDRGHLSYHWEIRYSPSANNGEAIYASRGITGYRDPVLKIDMQSMPSFEQLADKRWRLKLTITREPHSDYPMSVAPFISTYFYSFLYTEAASTLAMAQACQQHENPHPSCQNNQLLRAPAGTY